MSGLVFMHFYAVAAEVSQDVGSQLLFWNECGATS